MRRPPSLSLTRGLLSAMILIALAGAHLRAQTSSPTSGPIETIAPKTTANSADLPDSPGTTLRRRIPPADESGETASAADQSLIPQQVAGSTSSSSTAGSPAGSSTMTGAEARASDTRGIGNCLAATRATQGGIIELKSYTPNAGPDPAPALTRPLPACPPAQALNPYQRFLNSGTPIPLTPRQKAYLAVHNFIDPGNIVTIIGTSGVAIATDSHTAYGPGWRGFGRDAGISAVQDATGDFFGTFLIPSLTHEDPHYHRMPNASIPRRTLHAISRTVIAQSDDGHPMPNYATLLTYPITAEIANLYVPGIASNGPSTVERVLTGYATDPIDNLITEFLPDVAKRIHVRVIFVQQIINQVAAGQPVTMFP